jgi:hypothetical protein
VAAWECPRCHLVNLDGAVCRHCSPTQGQGPTGHHDQELSGSLDKDWSIVAAVVGCGLIVGVLGFIIFMWFLILHIAGK